MRRIEALLERAKLDALIGYSVGNQAGPVAYLAGYEPRFGQRDVAAFVLVPGKRYALALYAYWDLPELQTWTQDVHLTRDLGATLSELLPESARRVGVAGYSFFPAPIAAALAHHTLVDVSSLLMEAARIKTTTEIALLREATRQTDAGVRALLDGVAPGTDERELAMSVQAAIVKAGADRLAFPVLLFSGELSETGIGFPRPRQLQAGDQLNVVCGASFCGYNADVGRVAFVGSPTGETRKLLDTAEAMHAALFDAARPGQSVAGLARAGVDVVRERGHAGWLYRNAGPGYAGHGIGCWLDEPPRLQLDTTGELEPNMVLVLEARLGREGRGGVTLTDPVLITERGAERFSTVPICTWNDDD